MTLSYSKRTEPSKRLFDPNPETQHNYVSEVHTDIRATFAKVQAENETWAAWFKGQQAENDDTEWVREEV